MLRRVNYTRRHFKLCSKSREYKKAPCAIEKWGGEKGPIVIVNTRDALDDEENIKNSFEQKK